MLYREQRLLCEVEMAGFELEVFNYNNTINPIYFMTSMS